MLDTSIWSLSCRLPQHKAMPFCCVNLVDNAIRRIPPEGCTTMRVKLSDQAVILEVENSGPGIPSDERERIFERFYWLEWGMVRALELPSCETSPMPVFS
ncbi:ATP-binding protein [Pseudomonas sp. JZ134]|uniref:ATP-binding protein n=1 Tax=Pseudomonas sp. JZ134 TaxID=2806615 RepID=UPI003DA0199A